jgi:predicted deacetylase
MVTEGNPLMESQALTVEIHDVTPAHQAEVEVIRDAVHDTGIDRPTLLVVPRWEDPDGRAWDLRDHPDMVEWLQAEQRAGAEIVQHGLTHRAPVPPPPGWHNAFMYHWFSRGCAEFAHLGRDQATERLATGRSILHDCGLRPSGFVAPAWQQSREAIRALCDLGYRFTAFFNHVVPLTGRKPAVFTPALTFDAPGVLVDHCKRLIMRGLEFIHRSSPLLRVALHPGDVRATRLPHVLGRLRSLLRMRRVVTYRGWLR